MPECECGCGEIIEGYFKRGHWMRVKNGNRLSDEIVCSNPNCPSPTETTIRRNRLSDGTLGKPYKGWFKDVDGNRICRKCWVKLYYVRNKSMIDTHNKHNYIKQKSYRLEYSRKWRRDNIDHVNKTARLYRYNKKIEIFNILSNGSTPSCNKCGFDDIKALHIHHIGGDGFLDRKNKNMRTVTGLILYYIDKPVEEIRRKLCILCANCNWLEYLDRISQSQSRRSKYSRRLRMMILFELTDGDYNHIVCIKCGYNLDNRAIDIDHILGNGHKIRVDIGDLDGMYRFYRDHPELIKQDLQLLCKNCNNIKRVVKNEWRTKFCNPLKLKPIL